MLLSAGKLKQGKGTAVRRRNAGGYFLLITVLLVAAVGILFGFGRLLMFRYQCEIRFDRQREIDRTLATRSALRWLATQPTANLPTVETNFVYRAWAGRTINIAVRPMPSIYPNPTNSNHLKISNGQRGDENVVFTNSDYSAMQPNFIVHEDQPYVLKIGSEGTNTMGAGQAGSVEIDMPTLGSWLDDTYGRRYWVLPADVNLCEGGAGDVMRLYITPDGSDFKTSATAIWFEHAPIGAAPVPTTFWIKYNGITINLATINISSADAKGIQLAGNTMTPFSWQQPGKSVYGVFTFYDACNLPKELVDAFKDSSGKNKDLRLTLEVEALDPDLGPNSFKWIQVEPAYEFDIELTWNVPKTGGTTSEVATVVHLIPTKTRSTSTDNQVYTYDTHGTSTGK
jgi:hypothetical protein